MPAIWSSCCRSGAAVTLCLASGLMRGHGVPPLEALAALAGRA